MFALAMGTLIGLAVFAFVATILVAPFAR